MTLLVTALAASVLVRGVLAVLVFHGIIWPGRIFASNYQVRGVDISSYQGDVDWRILSSNDIDFAYIKATEGSKSIDPYFADNWSESLQTNLLVGARSLSFGKIFG